VKQKRKRRPPNKKFRKALGKRVKELRKNIKISQSQLGFETGVHREQIGHIERGMQSPSADTLEAMSNVFDMKLKDFLDFEY
jgi:transcriptional regulator with XRE-family HTH domain